jgi:hypothetical protein
LDAGRELPAAHVDITQSVRGRLAPLDVVLVMRAMGRDAPRWMTNTRKQMLQWTNVCCRV